MAKRKVINIGDTDGNADWIKTEENRRTEREIHDRLAAELSREEAETEGGE